MKVLKFTSIIFVVLVIILGILMWYSKKNKVWPPEIAQCPDYWAKETSSGKCRDTHQLNPDFSSGLSPDFDNKKYKGLAGMKEKCKWANRNKIYWAGITDARDSLCD